MDRESGFAPGPTAPDAGARAGRPGGLITDQVEDDLRGPYPGAIRARAARPSRFRPLDDDDDIPRSAADKAAADKADTGKADTGRAETGKAETGKAPVGPGRRPRRRQRLIVAGALLAAVIVVVGLIAFRLGSRSPSPTGQAATAPATTTTTTATTLAVTDIFRQVAPSVVVITTAKGSLGSGIVVTDTGTILTANHVVAGGGTLTVIFSDGTKTTATVAAANPKTDSAILTPASLPEVVVAATLGGGVAVGSDVVAIGNPLGLRDSTSSGVVSGLDRTAKTDAGTLSGLIQFDAAVNPGSSGGPLLNSQGLVVGVVSSIADPGDDDSFAGIGFAVPIAAALGGGSGKGPGPGGPQL